VHSPYRLLAGENIGSRFVVPSLAGCVDVVVHTGTWTDHDGVGRVREVVAVPSRVEGDVVELEPVFVLRSARLVRAAAGPGHGPPALGMPLVLVNDVVPGRSVPVVASATTLAPLPEAGPDDSVPAAPPPPGR
jgi:hypothetical protein